MNTTYEINRTGDEIAIIGMAGRFPGAKNIDEFWQNIKNGIESIAFLSEEELKATGVDPQLIANPRYVKSIGGVLEDKDCFDAFFFDYSPMEAEVINPQLRVFLECTWAALENAAYNPFKYSGRIGLYMGASSSTKWEGITYLNGKREVVGEFISEQFANKDFLPTLTAYKLDLKGPAVSLQTACSTSLVAVHMACQSILDGDCDIALAGGVSVTVEKAIGYLYQDGMVYSPDGHCRTFDANAKGGINGNGVGVVVLKTLDAALADGDHIYALIRGSAINNDGINKAGYAAPSVKAQADVIRAALQLAEVDPGAITHVETHGTATELGDPIEIEALKQAYHSEKKRYCAIGSVKTNVGHLDTAAGVTGLIKTALALKNKFLPPSLHFEKANPKIDLENSPFYVNTTLKEWPDSHGPRLAAVSSFGIGGTNAHVILEEAPPPAEDKPTIGDQTYQLLLLSAKTPAALTRMSQNMVDYLTENPTVNLADTAYTLQIGRQTFQHRLMAVCSQVDDAITVFSAPRSGKSSIYDSKDRKKAAIFLFPGIGAQYVDMGRGIYRSHPPFRQEIDRCFDILKSILGYDCKDILYPEKAVSSTGTPPSQNIGDTKNAQLAIFILEYALAQLLLKWGIKPRAMVGYSLGEYTAACLSGVFSLEDTLKILVTRGRLIDRLPTGTMLSVPMPAKEVAPLLGNELSIAIDNGPSCIVAGPDHLLERFQKQLKEKRCLCIQLPNAHAIHSRMMEPILTEFEESFRHVTLHVPQIPYISNLTGTWISKQNATDPRYWARHLKETVRFADTIDLLKKEVNAIFIEIGPGRDLSTLLVRASENEREQQAVNLIRPLQQDIADDYFLLNKIGKLWQYGVEIDWPAFNEDQKRQRLPLPAYSFEKNHFVIDDDIFKNKGKILSQENVFRKNPNMTEWFYVPVWEQSFLSVYPPKNEATSNFWLLFLDETELGAHIFHYLLKKKQQVVTVKTGHAFAMTDFGHFVINPADPDQYDLLFAQIQDLKIAPQRILHLWNLSPDMDMDTAFANMDDFLDNGFYSIIYTVQSLTKKGLTHPIQFQVVTGGIHNITGEEKLNPLQATVLGPVKIIPLEYSNIRCCSVDILLPAPGSARLDKLVHDLLGEFERGFPDILIAFRGSHRWVQKIKYHPLDTSDSYCQRLKENGTYLITGGLGGMGFAIAEHMALQFKANLILVGRSPFPEPAHWSTWLDSHDKNDTVSTKILKLQEFEAHGARVMVACADVGNEERMRAVVADAETMFGHIDGILHTAGVVDNEGVIQRRTRAMNDLSMNPKVRGAIVLHRIFKNKKPSFLVLFSSLGNIIYKVKFGQVGYNAANEFLDSFGQVNDPQGQTHLLTINWTDWREVGMAVYTLMNRAGKTNKIPDFDAELHAALLSVEGVEVFNRMLGSGLKRVAVSSQDLLAGLEYMAKAELDDPLMAKAEDRDPLFRYERPPLITEYMSPVTPTEKQLVDIWAEFFGFQQVGILDDFFELGGDSLKAITLLGKIHKKMDAKIPLMELFKHPNIQKLGQFITMTEATQFVAIPIAERKEYYVLSSVQKKIFFTQQIDSQSTAYNMPLIAQIKGHINKEKFAAAFTQLYQRHDCFRTAIDIINEEPVQRIHAHVHFEVGYQEGQIENIEEIMSHFIRPFDLSQAPLVRVVLVNIGTDEHVLMVDMHHVISDFVSHNILIAEFAALYGGQDLAPLRVQYKDYSEWQNSLFTSGAMDKKREYWLSRFAVGSLSRPNTLFDYPRPPVRRIDAGASLQFSLNSELLQKIHTLMEKTGATLSIVLLTIYNIMLHRYTREEDIVIGVVSTGRSHADLEKLIGMFLNSFPLRSQPQKDKEFIQFLADVMKDFLNAFENQDYNLDEIVDQLGMKAESGRNLLFDVAFNLYNMEQNQFKHENFEVSLYGTDQDYAKYDLTLYGHEQKDTIELRFRYSTQLFKRSTIEKFGDYFINIAEQVLDKIDIKLKDITFAHDYLIAKPKQKQDEADDFIL